VTLSSLPSPFPHQYHQFPPNSELPSSLHPPATTSTMADPRKSASMVQIKKLHLPFPVSTMSAWGQLKEQPAFVTVSIEFRDEFASGKDDLSGSIHYGELSKRIRALVPILASGFWPGDLSEAIENVVFEMGSEQVRQARGPVLCNYSKHHAALKDFRLGQISKTSANASTYHPQHPEGQREQNPILNVVSELHFPKASMTGDEIVITRTKKVELNSYGEAVPSIERPIFSIPNMRLMTIIGMNPHERKARQPVVASLTVEYTHVSLEDSDSEGTEVCFKEIDAVFVERVVVKVSTQPLSSTHHVCADADLFSSSKSQSTRPWSSWRRIPSTLWSHGSGRENTLLPLSACDWRSPRRSCLQRQRWWSSTSLPQSYNHQGSRKASRTWSLSR